jgi:signal transduction histidine kinase
MKAFEILNRKILFLSFLAAFLLVSVPPLLVSGSGLLRRTEDELKSSLNENNYLIARSIADQLDESRVAPWSALLRSLASSLESARTGNPGAAGFMIDQAFRQTPALAVLSLETERRSKPLHYINRSALSGLENQDSRKLADLFSSASDSGSGGRSETIGRPVLFDSNRIVFLPIRVPSAPERDGAGTLRGVFRISPALESIDQDLSSVERQIYVVDGDGTILFRNRHGRFDPGSVLPYPLGNAGGQEPQVFRTLAFASDDTMRLGYCFPMQRTGWRVVLVSARDRAYAPIGQTRRQILASLGMALALSLVLSALFAWFHSSVIVNAKDALQRYADKLEQSNAELDAFALSISHDLSAPLRHIMGYADILEMKFGPSLDPKGLGHLRNIAQAARNLHGLIQHVLVFSKMGHSEIHKTRVDLEALVEAARARLTPDSGGPPVSWTVEPGVTLWGDSTMLQLVLSNLLSNALKFTSGRSDPSIEIGVLRDPNETTVYVRDNGVGFDMKERGRLFGLFQRLHTREDFEGSGVGLAHVRRIVTKHGGRTWAEGRPGEGATFYFTLPVEPRARRKR